MADELASLTLAQAASAIANRRLSAVELTRASLERLTAAGGALNCVAGIDHEMALESAERADSAPPRARGPLHGVPLAHKDMYYRIGRVSACGSRIRADFVADHTATVLERLDEAGALDVARLNMVEFAYGPTGHNEITGTPRNPWNTDHITGGSSSGSAAAVAAGLVYGSLGSDTDGCIRIPASCCGLVGMKPSYGRASRYGSLGLSFALDHPGPLTRTVEDCALLLQAICGSDPSDATTSGRPVPDFLAGLEKPIRGLRLAVPENYFYDPVVPEVRRVMEESLAVFKGLGVEIVPVTMLSIELANSMAMLVMAVEAAVLHGPWLRERPNDYGRQTFERLVPGLLYPSTRYVDALNVRGKVLKDFVDSVFWRADLLHLPVLPIEVPTIAESDVAANPSFSEFLPSFGHCTRPFNYLGVPAVSVPAGITGNGLPCGMQLVGRPFDEVRLLQAARAYERETGSTSSTSARAL